ncbi:hypothetical protein AGR7A_Cc280025 [Agrobacterium deltaense NCPPB 1641]|uniref:Uncharacterized protein n=1 Tax=Agrobacterium deltaense NCPPB 1641 TaxID=1183425 RepID=A0A1S7TPF7_9HYPH|nr:hypothetical protein AGR7A_Cc280025 [Agrobacterium deltaense NCPPB 1641]
MSVELEGLSFHSINQRGMKTGDEFPVVPTLNRKPVNAAFPRREESFQPKDLGWLDAGSGPA